MGITLFTVRELIASLRSLMNWLVRAPAGQCRAPEGRPAAACRAALKDRASSPTVPLRSREKPRRPLRVVRVVDATHERTVAGRMFMSGRMADVCAELDRLAALEAAAG